MNKVRFSLLLTSLISMVLLAACGGGGSSGGGPQFAGTYTGNFTITIMGPRNVSNTQSGTTTVVINADNTVVVDPGTPGQFTGTISGNTFTAVLPASRLNQPGFTCTGSVTMTGTGSGNVFTGTFSGNTICNGIRFITSGTFSVSKVARESLLKTTILEELQEAVRGAEQ